MHISILIVFNIFSALFINSVVLFVNIFIYNINKEEIYNIIKRDLMLLNGNKSKANEMKRVDRKTQ